MNHPTVLYVENDDNDVLLMRRAWTKAGIRERLQTVPNGEEAVRYLSGQGPYVNRVEHPMPRLVVLDLRLPTMSGLEVLKSIRMRPDLHYLPVVMLTASNRPADREAAAAIRADQYILKPGPFSEWVAMVTALKKAWLERETP
jgi:CheY-like chemotaxis protein